MKSKKNQLKNRVDFAAMPAKDTTKALHIINQFFPQFSPVENVFETSIIVLFIDKSSVEAN